MFGMRMHCRDSNFPNALCPGVDLGKYGRLGSAYAGFHYDLNFLTIHGRSRFPGLAVWLQDGTRMPVSVPDGCLLIQAGKQIEWFTAGRVRAGMHEVRSPLDACASATGMGTCTHRAGKTWHVRAHLPCRRWCAQRQRERQQQEQQRRGGRSGGCPQQCLRTSPRTCCCSLWAALRRRTRAGMRPCWPATLCSRSWRPSS